MLTWDDATLNYRARLVAVYEARFYRLIMQDLPGWREALGALQAAREEYFLALVEAGR